ncbi:alpha/beta hydrolase [Natrinema salsiterrestre]|uniref:Alpha/beta hydrolase n=1 Tax=Natrinema salsiterrestre TaxID=2950540 RepID=A0A9Q4Q440_9EURY|nr:alpha/beta hydrolase [Natrinema salsiterrestre]MDF9746897.1 alpha/beta hydrolase [Natrinema salsiterrestre]
MTFDRQRDSAAGNSDTTNDVSRRGLLRTTATAVVAGTGLSVASGSVAADTDEIMEVDFRGGVPPISDAPQGEDEVVFVVHGYTGSSDSVAGAETFQQTARSVGYTETVTAVTWDDSGLPWSAEDSARETGDLFAGWLEDYTNANPDTTIRILGHSMGGIVQMETLAAIDGAFTVDTADSIGSYEESDAPCECGDFYDAIRDSAGEVHNYYSTNDWIAKLGGGPADCSGWYCDDTLPDNYEDVDVSDSVSGHSAYKESAGCVSKIVDNY